MTTGKYIYKLEETIESFGTHNEEWGLENLTLRGEITQEKQGETKHNLFNDFVGITLNPDKEGW